MSTYENYDRTSRHYDHTRVPVGGEIIVGCLAGQRKPLHELVVLDAGCGTGAYTGAIVEGVGRVAAIDMSRGMIEAARAKLRDQAAAARVGFLRGSIAALPFAAESFDAVMINQVLHHLDDSAAEDFPAHRRVIGEFARVLRRGGALLVNSCSHRQLRDGYWYRQLVPRAAESMCRRFVPLEVLRRAVADKGDMTLSALRAAVAAAGSLIVGLALEAGRIDARQAYEIALLDELFQTESWGWDQEATTRRAAIEAELEAAARFLALLEE